MNASLRESGDSLELKGIEFARDRLAQADLAIHVFDRSQVFSASFELPETPRRRLIVHNKCDLPRHPGDRPAGIEISATRGDGLTRLMSRIVTELVPVAPIPGDAVPFTGRQVDLLTRALRQIEAFDLDAGRETLAAF